MLSYTFTQVTHMEVIKMKWSKAVSEMRTQYQWLMFLSLPKQLVLYQRIRQYQENEFENKIDSIMQELLFLISMHPTIRGKLKGLVQVSKNSWAHVHFEKKCLIQ